MPPSTAKAKSRARQQATLANHGWSETDEFVPDGAPDSTAPVAAATPETDDWGVAATSTPATVNAMQPAASAPTPAAKAPRAVAAPAKSAPVAKADAPAAAVSDASGATIKSRTCRFYVVAGSYDTPRSVEKARAALASKNRPAQVLWPVRPTRTSAGSRFYRLTVGEFADQATADRNLSQLRKQYGSSLWVLQY